MNTEQQLEQILREYREVCFTVRDNMPSIDGLHVGISNAKAALLDLIEQEVIKGRLDELVELAKEIFSDVEIETYTDCLELLYERIAELTKLAEVSL